MELFNNDLGIYFDKREIIAIEVMKSLLKQHVTYGKDGPKDVKTEPCYGWPDMDQGGEIAETSFLVAEAMLQASKKYKSDGKVN